MVGKGAVGGSAESSDAPWSSGPKELSRPRRTRVPLGVHVHARAPQLRPHSAHTGVGPLESPLLSAFPTRTSCPRAPLCGPTAPPGRIGHNGGPDVGGVFCANPRAGGSCSWKGSGRTKQAGLVGRRSRSGAPPPIPPGVAVGGGSVAWFGEE